MKEECGVTKFREGDTKEHEGVTYVAVRQNKRIFARGVRSTSMANRAKAQEGGYVLR